MADLLTVSTATPTREAALKLAESVIAAGLAAGGQVAGPVASTFWHEGKFGTGEEWTVSFKTTAARYSDLEAHLIEHHEWTNPEVTAVPGRRRDRDRTRAVHQQAEGLEGWFDLSGTNGLQVPPKWKMAVVTWCTIFPLLVLANTALMPLSGGLPWIASLAIGTAVTVPIMTWLAMPTTTRLLRPWLFRAPAADIADRV